MTFTSILSKMLLVELAHEQVRRLALPVLYFELLLLSNFLDLVYIFAKGQISKFPDFHLTRFTVRRLSARITEVDVNLFIGACLQEVKLFYKDQLLPHYFRRASTILFVLAEF